MEYRITTSPDGKMIILKIKGEITGKSAMAPNLEAHKLGKRLGIHRYLVDATEARNTDSVSGNYEFAYSAMQKTQGINRHARVATVIRPGDYSHDFVETVARNAGLNVRLFTDMGLARKFLLEDIPPPGPADEEKMT